MATFYGDLNSAEARYPGLNYCYPPHRMRLGRFKHHRRLFDAFDQLGLTYNEIQDFCCWEGTKWARERYEKDEGVKVVDTTGDDVGPYVDRRDRRAADEARRHSITRKTEVSITVEDATLVRRRQIPIEEDDEDMNDAAQEDEDEEREGEDQAGDGEDEEEDVEDDEDEEGNTDVNANMHAERESPSERAAREQHQAELEHRRGQAVQQRINQRIIAAWEQGQSLSPEIEQYLKEQSERGNPELSRLLASRRSSQQQRYTSAEHTALVATQTSRATV